MSKRNNIDDAIECLKELKKKPGTSADEKKNIDKKIRELKKYK